VQKKSLIPAVDAYLAAMRLNGSAPVLGALASVLAASLEESPAYARARLAAELRAVLAELGELEQDAAYEGELAARRAARKRQTRWAEEG
jgi:hypothetical protein